jgi:basic membrane protein A
MSNLRNISRIFVLGVALMMLFTSCAPTAQTPTTAPIAPTVAAPTTAPTTAPTKAPIRVALVINGTLGDLGFFDSANAGVQKAAKDFGMQVKVIEATYDTTKWEPAFTDAANGPYDVVIAGSSSMEAIVEKVAPQFPDKQFILFDVAADFTKCACTNIYGITYRYNEAGYLAGALAAKITTSSMPRANAAKVIGFVGGMDIPVINDFLIGYQKGVADTDPTVTVLTAYAGDFNNPTKGKELTTQMIAEGADVVWAVAGATGLGVYEGAMDGKIYAIAVNENQVQALLSNNADYANTIVGAGIANVGNSLYLALKAFADGTLVTGKNISYGVKEGVVELENNQYYQAAVPADIRTQMSKLQQEIVDGTIVIPSSQ